MPAMYEFIHRRDAFGITARCLRVTVDESATWNQSEPWIQVNSHHVLLHRACWIETI